MIAQNMVRLVIRSDPDWQWELRARLLERGGYFENEKKIVQNDLDLPPLGAAISMPFQPGWSNCGRIADWVSI